MKRQWVQIIQILWLFQHFCINNSQTWTSYIQILNIEDTVMTWSELHLNSHNTSSTIITYDAFLSPIRYMKELFHLFKDMSTHLCAKHIFKWKNIDKQSHLTKILGIYYWKTMNRLAPMNKNHNSLSLKETIKRLSYKYKNPT
jgi:hypothetical protein